MSSVRRNQKVDANQAVIVAALRQAGAVVQSLASVGKGVPDLLVGYLGHTVMMEVKDSAKVPSARKLTEEQLKWHAAWQGGTLAVVDSPKSALRVLGVIRESAA